MKLVSRDVTYNIEDLNKVTVGPDDVIIARLDMTGINATQQVMYSESVGRVLGDTFPNNKVLVLNKNIAITIATITP